MTIRGENFRIKERDLSCISAKLATGFFQEKSLFLFDIYRMREEPAVLQGREQFNHPSAHSCVRQRPDSCQHIIFEVARFIRCRNDTRDGRVGDDPFQKKLRPGATIKFSSPIRQRLRTHSLENVAAAEWAIYEHRDPALLR